MKCFHHDDKDGRGAAFIVYINNKDKMNKEDFFEMNYTMEFPYDKVEKDEVVYIVDFSIKDNEAYKLDKLLKITKNVIWIDHHKSSFYLLKVRPDFNAIKGLRVNKISGMALAAMYFNKCYIFEKLPKYIRFISDYDCWIYRYGIDTEYFSYGVDANNQSPTDPDSIWMKLYMDERKCSNNTILNLISNGKIISSYLETANKDYLDKNGFEAELLGYNIKVVNKHSNSIAFGNEIHSYDFVCCFRWDGKTYVYSIFTTKNYIDCEQIAKHFGGGGHEQAAGFILPYNLFNNHRLER